MNFGPVAGIDVSKRFSDMCILSPDNKIFAREKIYHDETSINRSNTLLQKAEQGFVKAAQNFWEPETDAGLCFVIPKLKFGSLCSPCFLLDVSG